jgi:hypothetical protein
VGFSLARLSLTVAIISFYLFVTQLKGKLKPIGKEESGIIEGKGGNDE